MAQEMPPTVQPEAQPQVSFSKEIATQIATSSLDPNNRNRLLQGLPKPIKQKFYGGEPGYDLRQAVIDARLGPNHPSLQNEGRKQLADEFARTIKDYGIDTTRNTVPLDKLIDAYLKSKGLTPSTQSSTEKSNKITYPKEQQRQYVREAIENNPMPNIREEVQKLFSRSRQATAGREIPPKSIDTEVETGTRISYVDDEAIAEAVKEELRDSKREPTEAPEYASTLEPEEPIAKQKEQTETETLADRIKAVLEEHRKQIELKTTQQPEIEDNTTEVEPENAVVHSLQRAENAEGEEQKKSSILTPEDIDSMLAELQSQSPRKARVIRPAQFPRIRKSTSTTQTNEPEYVTVEQPEKPTPTTEDRPYLLSQAEIDELLSYHEEPLQAPREKQPVPPLQPPTIPEPEPKQTETLESAAETSTEADVSATHEAPRAPQPDYSDLPPFLRRLREHSRQAAYEPTPTIEPAQSTEQNGEQSKPVELPFWLTMPEPNSEQPQPGLQEPLPPTYNPPPAKGLWKSLLDRIR